MYDFLKQRSLKEEIMDDFFSQGEVVDQTLREIHQINAYLGGDQLSLNAVKNLVAQFPRSKYDVADLGCGGGDTLKLFARWFKKKHIEASFTGIDANAYIIEYARKNCRKHQNIDLVSENVMGDQFRDRTFDIAHASLFLHHFQEEEIIELLRQLHDQVRIGIVINDLHRHWVSYLFTKHLITQWSKSEMVKYDSVVSIERSFLRAELERYLELAGLKKYSLKWKWAYRWELVIWK